MTAPAFALCTKCTRNHTAEGICVPCQASESPPLLSLVRTKEPELGTRNEELGKPTRKNLHSFSEILVPSSSELGSGCTPSSDLSALQRRIVDKIDRMRAERVAQLERPAGSGDPSIVPFALSLAVEHCGAVDKSEAKRAVDALVKSGVLVLEYELAKRGKRFGTRCYSLPDGEAS